MLGVGGTEGGPWSVAGTAAQLKGRGRGVARGGSLGGCPQGKSLCTSPDSGGVGGGLRRFPSSSQSVHFIGNRQGSSLDAFSAAITETLGVCLSALLVLRAACAVANVKTSLAVPR